MQSDAIELSLFSSRINAICDEMGAVLQRAAFSPNIKERLDFSCALFDARGQLAAQAAHIPVHLGSMAYAMADLVKDIDWQPDDVVVVNDPYLGGTHLPDITVISPFFHNGQLLGYVCNRAHHADIGAHSPGSMPISTTLAEEGLILSPTHLYKQGKLQETVMQRIRDATQKPWQAEGDFNAQISANRVGLKRLNVLLDAMPADEYHQRIEQLNDYGEQLCRTSLKKLRDGVYRFEDFLDDDGQGMEDLRIAVTVSVAQGKAEVDFAGTQAQVKGNVNCPLSVAAAGVYYVFRCLMPEQTPACAGSLRPIKISAPSGCLLNANRPSAVAAGNVETSSRIVDTVMGAVQQALPGVVPAASQGTMNNLAMGGRREWVWDYYETLGGGMGGGPHSEGLSAVQTHLTNTRNTPIEDLEMNFPLRISRYSIRRRSGGRGKHRGGDGLIREYRFLTPTHVTLLTERRRRAPWGAEGGGDGLPGENRLNGERLPGKTALQVQPGDCLTIVTPGGGGWGE